MSQSPSPPPFLRTPDANFDGLADFPFQPHYLDVHGLRMHYVDDAPFAGLGEDGVAGPRQFPLLIPVHDHSGGNGDAQAAHFAAIAQTPLPVHFVWGLADEVFTGAWGRRWHELIPHSTWDAFDDAAHFVQDTHGDRVAQVVLDRIGA